MATRSENVSAQKAKTAANYLLKQVDWLHKHGLCHGDINLKNILWCKKRQLPVIIDFEKGRRVSKHCFDFKALITEFLRSDLEFSVAIGDTLLDRILAKKTTATSHSV